MYSQLSGYDRSRPVGSSNFFCMPWMKRRLTALLLVPLLLSSEGIDSSERSYLRVDTPITKGYRVQSQSRNTCS